MGILIYGNTLKLDIDDRTLAHVRSIVFAKLRAQEAFPFTVVRITDKQACESTSFWISSDTPIVFQLSDDGPKELSREWIEELMKSSYENRGLVISVEAPSDFDK
ncbi:MAG: DUF7882 family protein [Leucobacter sp.]